MVSIDVAVGDVVHGGQQIAVLEAMKMEFIVTATSNGVVRQIVASIGETVSTGQPLLFIEPVDASAMREQQVNIVDLDAIRPDLQEAQERHAVGLDELRPEAVERRRRSGQRTVRENIVALCDPGSFIEYGALTLAGQRRRRTLEELIKISPADGLVAGIGNINGQTFPDEQSRCMVLAYDYTVFAGTQGGHGEGHGEGGAHRAIDDAVALGITNLGYLKARHIGRRHIVGGLAQGPSIVGRGRWEH